MKKGLKILIIVLASILGLILAIAILISPIAKSYIQKNDKELLGREVTMDKFRLNIFTGSLSIDSLNVYEKDDKNKFISINEFKFNMKIYPLLAKKFVVQRVLLSGADINIYQKGSEFNFDDIIKKFSSEDTIKETKDTTASDWEIALNNIEINKTDITYKDLEINTNWGLYDFALKIPAMYFSNKSSDIGINLKFKNGGSLALNAKYNMHTTNYILNIALQNFSLSNVLPYLQQSMNISQVAGLLSTKLNISGDFNHIMDFKLKGDVGANNFSLIDDKQRNVVSMNKLDVSIDEISLSKNKYHINLVKIDALTSQFDLYKDSTNNFSFLMKPSPQEPNKDSVAVDTTKTQPSKTMDLIIKELLVENSSFIFNDQSIQKPLSYPIENINIKSNNFTLDKENQLELTATLSKTGKVNVKWQGYADGIANHNLMLIINNLNLNDFTPYSLEYFARPLSKGNLTFTSQNIIKDYNLKGTNKVDIYKCEVGNKDNQVKAEYGNVPLKLGLYVLKDRKDKIILDLPVKGNVKSPEFSYKKLIFKTLINLLVKVATSPISLVAEQLGYDPEALSNIPIEPMDREFTSEQFEKFKQLSEISNAKPELILTLTQEINYQKAISELSMANLKIAYYKKNNPSSQEKNLDLIDIDQVKNISTKDESFIVFTDFLLVEKGLNKIGSMEDKAVSLYKEASEEQLQTLMQERNTKLTQHFTEALKIDSSKIKVQSLSIDELKSKTTKSQYAISLEVLEQAEVSEEDK
jgi:hypothetical protein